LKSITALAALVNNEDLSGVTKRFNCENPFAHLLEDIGTLPRLCINLNKLSEILFFSRYSRKICIISLSFKPNLVEKFTIYVSPDVN
jgi:hypothetical protein